MSAIAHAGGPLGCVGLAALLAGRGRLLRASGLLAWAAGALLLAVYLAPSGHTAVYVAAGLVGAGVALAGAWTLRRWPWALAGATLLLVPARVPITVGSTEAQLLVPLYVVVGAAAVWLASDFARGDVRSRELGVVTLPLAAFVAWTGLSLSWTIDLKKGAVELLFFFLPFGLLALALARLPWGRRLFVGLYLELTAMALLFALVGIYQEAARDVFWNPKVIVGDAYAPFFRVNSLFWDPSIYGRFLVVAILVNLVVVLFASDRRVRVAAAAAIALVWVGLLFSYSQSSFVSLVVGVLVAAAYAFRPRPATAAVATAALVLLGLAAGSPSRALAFGSPPTLLAQTSNGRAKLVTEGIEIALDHPLEGVGVGGFKRAYADRVGLRGTDPQRAASHTTPVTVVAEEGIVGFLLFVWLAIAALWLAFRRAGAGFPGQVLLALGLTLLAISVHSLGYDALFEDPSAWGALGLAACVAAATRREGELA